MRNQIVLNYVCWFWMVMNESCIELCMLVVNGYEWKLYGNGIGLSCAMLYYIFTIKMHQSFIPRIVFQMDLVNANGKVITMRIFGESKLINHT